MDLWPALPLVVQGSTTLTLNTDNILAALGQSNRVCQLELHLAGRESVEVLAAMEVPFPEMTRILLFSDDEIDDEAPPTIPDSFLGGFAPRLQSFRLDGIPFPGLPILLSSATNLVSLFLSKIPHSGLHLIRGDGRTSLRVVQPQKTYT